MTIRTLYLLESQQNIGKNKPDPNPYLSRMTKKTSHAEVNAC